MAHEGFSASIAADHSFMRSGGNGAYAVTRKVCSGARLIQGLMDPLSGWVPPRITAPQRATPPRLTEIYPLRSLQSQSSHGGRRFVGVPRSDIGRESTQLSQPTLLGALGTPLPLTYCCHIFLKFLCGPAPPWFPHRGALEMKASSIPHICFANSFQTFRISSENKYAEVCGVGDRSETVYPQGGRKRAKEHMESVMKRSWF